MSTSGVLLPFNITGKVDPEVEMAIRSLWKGVTDSHAAITQLVPKVNAGSGTAIPPTVTPPSVISGGGGSSSPIGSVNSQGGTSYLLVNSDYGALVLLTNTGAVNVTLNNVVALPFYCVIQYFGAAQATLTPVSGLVNNLPSWVLPAYYSALVFYDGINWWVTVFPLFPQTVNAIVSQFLNSYDATTGLFTTAQPKYSDLTGTPTIPGLLVFANNAAAIAGGLVAGNLYRSGADPDAIFIVH